MAVSIHLPKAWDTETNFRTVVEDNKEIMQECANKGHKRATSIIIAGDFNDNVRATTEWERVIQ